MGAVKHTRLGCLFTLVLIFSCVHSHAEKPLSSVADLRYGVALYEYYQEEYMDALAELLVAKERGGIQGHGDNPEIMEGGFAVGYGMERHASDIFLRLLEENRPQHVRDAAWFFLAKLRYIRDDWGGTQFALDNIRKNPSGKIRADINALKINLAIQLDNVELAEQLFKDLSVNAGWLPYIHHNLGSAWARQAEFPKALEHFEQVGGTRFIDEEHVALYDQSMTSAGYAHLLSGNYQESIKKFSKVRLNADTSNRALLGYGWANDRIGNHKEALKSWTHLSNSNLLDASNQEALVAVPFAYERLGAETLALKSFREAEQKLLAEIASLDQIIVDMKNDRLIEILRIKRSRGLDWLRYAEENDLAPQLSYLVQLFSRDEFQGSVQELRDLLAIQEDMALWREKLDFYMGMIDSREAERAKKAAYMENDPIFQSISEMVKKRAELAKKIEKTAIERDYFALSSGDEADLVFRALRVKKNIELLRETDPFVYEYEEAARRYHGILLWQASEEFSDRMWYAVKTLNALDKTIHDMRENHESVTQLLSKAQDLEPYKLKINQSREKIDYELIHIDDILEKNKVSIRKQIVDILNIQRGRLSHYLAQSRLATARILDRATRGEGRGDMFPDSKPATVPSPEVEEQEAIKKEEIEKEQPIAAKNKAEQVVEKNPIEDIENDLIQEVEADEENAVNTESTEKALDQKSGGADR